MTKYLDLAIANETIKTTGIERKDKNGNITVNEYAQVNERIKAFRMVYPQGFIKTKIEELKDGICTMTASVGYYDIVNGESIEIELGTGTAQEKEDSSFINKTSYIENCETSAVGRALGMCGFGIDVSVASAEEVQNAIANQEPTEEDAKNYEFTFGKYKGKKLSEVLEEDSQYVDWMINNKNDEYFKKCYELLTGVKLPTEAEQDERISLIAKINELARETDTDIEEIHKHFTVGSISELTTKQMDECIKILEKKILKKICN